jgi:hypothetical protein
MGIGPTALRTGLECPSVAGAGLATSGPCLAVMAAIQPLLVFPIISIIRICKTLLAGL